MGGPARSPCYPPRNISRNLFPCILRHMPGWHRIIVPYSRGSVHDGVRLWGPSVASRSPCAHLGTQSLTGARRMKYVFLHVFARRAPKELFGGASLKCSQLLTCLPVGGRISAVALTEAVDPAQGSRALPLPTCSRGNVWLARRRGGNALVLLTCGHHVAAKY